VIWRDRRSAVRIVASQRHWQEFCSVKGAFVFGWSEGIRAKPLDRSPSNQPRRFLVADKTCEEFLRLFPCSTFYALGAATRCLVGRYTLPSQAAAGAQGGHSKPAPVCFKPGRGPRPSVDEIARCERHGNITDTSYGLSDNGPRRKLSLGFLLSRY
jgi:hypothetical protein